MHDFTVKELIRQLSYIKERYPDVPDDKINIYIERIKDEYFEKHGWTTKIKVRNDSTPYDQLDLEVLQKQCANGVEYSDYNYETEMIPAFTGITFPPNEDGIIDFLITPHY